MNTRAVLCLAMVAACNDLLAACNNSPPPGDAKPAATPSTPSMPANDASAASSAAPTTAGAAPRKAAPKVTDTFMTGAGELTVTPIHHATMLLQVGGKAIYLDPVAADASYEGLPKADYVFVTDIHPDHMDPAGLAKVKKDGTVVVAPPAVNEKMPAQVVMKNGDTHDFGTFKVEAIPMYNLTRGPSPGQLYHDKGRGDGYVFTFGAPKTDAGATASRVYVSGDTECTPEMKALKNIDVAFVCMNLPYTMPPAEAAACVNAFKPKVVFPFHYNGSNLDELSSAIKPASGIEVRRREWY
ncbi:MAG: Metal-dependent hydrolase [Labilithrix sp.]|nr:Metal-dependent hydrolase [Labilithrix sp.]